MLITIDNTKVSVAHTGSEVLPYWRLESAGLYIKSMNMWNYR